MWSILISGGSVEMRAAEEACRRSIRAIIPGTYLEFIPDQMRYIIFPMIYDRRELGEFCDIDLLCSCGCFYDRATLPTYRPPMVFIDVIIKYGVRVDAPDNMPNRTGWIHVAHKGWNYLVRLDLARP